MASEILELEIRRNIYDLVRRTPGLHMRELQRQLDLSIALTEYHLRLLEGAELIVSIMEEGYKRYYPTTGADGGKLALGGDERRMVGLFRQSIPLRVTLFLLNRDSATNSEIADGLGISRSRLSFHLNKMMRQGILRRLARSEGRGYALIDHNKILKLLIAHRPSPDLLDECADLWDTLEI
ncbi:MAG: winged helix-turn-helix transcriptional regulator [Thermoplasmata archaeon]|nr:winged helix-turn-helix transcriptional regulator [Thermoplasmata archaeon]